MASEQSPLRLERLTPASRAFADQLFSAHPELQTGATMTTTGDLRVQISSPTGDASRSLTIWVEGAEPRLAFGGWQTHAGLWDGADSATPILRLLDAMLADKVVLLFDLEAGADVSPGMVDLTEEDALLNEIAGRWSPGRLRLRSWTGAADRQVGLDDLNAR